MSGIVWHLFCWLAQIHPTDALVSQTMSLSANLWDVAMPTALKRSFPTALAIAVTITGAMPALAADNAKLWQALRNNQAFAIMRHAIAPGTGDPNNFTIDDCRTQRNLSEAGRTQARQIGELFRRNGLSSAAVYSSQWCRSNETARLLGLGTVKPLPALNSFFEEMQKRGTRTTSLRRWLATQKSDRPLIMVSHQVNISALTSRFTKSGETIVARLQPSGKIEVLGSVTAPVP